MSVWEILREDGMMIQIGICDDEREQRDWIKKLCSRYFYERKLEFGTILFDSGERVLAYNGERLHLLFLDIEMEDIDGIKVLREMEKTEKVWRVVFISSHEEDVWDTFGLKTLGFIRKPVSYEGIKKWLDIMIWENDENAKIEFEASGKKKWIELERLYYVEAERNYVYFHEMDEKTLVTGNLKSWEQELKFSSIIRVHKSYLVNLLNVDNIGNEIFLKNGEVLSIGRQYRNTVRESYDAYLRKKIRGRMQT